MQRPQPRCVLCRRTGMMEARRSEKLSWEWLCAVCASRQDQSVKFRDMDPERERGQRARKKYLATHREQIRQRQREYREKHRERYHAYNRRYYLAHRELRGVYNAAYRERHREELRAYNREYRRLRKAVASPPDLKFRDVFAQWARHLAWRARLSHAQLARRMDTSKSYVTKVLNGRGLPQLAVLERMAAALGVSPRRLVGIDAAELALFADPVVRAVAQRLPGMAQADRELVLFFLQQRGGDAAQRSAA